MCDQIGQRGYRFRFAGLRAIGRNDRHFSERRIVEALGQRILHQRFLELESGAGNGQVLVAFGDLGLGFHHVHLGHCLEL